jgi:hypothetical protein
LAEERFLCGCFSLPLDKLTANTPPPLKDGDALLKRAGVLKELVVSTVVTLIYSFSDGDLTGWMPRWNMMPIFLAVSLGVPGHKFSS